jgi:3'-phosphoadenosine 5'-phosphosulfate sulfotransferase (PAPS reductase)/FAD synthetase
MSNNTENDLQIYNKTVQKFLALYNKITDDFMERITYSLNYLTEISATVLQDHDIFISFNGGKDCLCAYILIKYYFFCKQFNLDYSQSDSYSTFTLKHKNFKIREKNIFLIYFIHENNFEQEEDYVLKFQKEEGINIIFIYSDYITGMKLLIQKYKLNIVIMGTRKDDVKSYSDVNCLLCPSTAPYPEFFRFFPVFNWGYEDVWRLILSSKTSYLELYDMGYSSIGRKNNTKLNESLRFSSELFYPAWCLEDNISERNFRT